MIRHAQAADAPGDRDRPLTAQGMQNAAAIGSWLEGNGYVPDRAVVSPALRTRQTWEQVAEASPAGVTSDVDERIYDNTVDAVLDVIAETPEDVQTLVVVGHNPSVGELSFALDDGMGDPGAQRKLHAGFPAGGVAVFEVAGLFADIAPDAATLTAFEVPTA